jgi:hypothetical protein
MQTDTTKRFISVSNIQNGKIEREIFFTLEHTILQQSFPTIIHIMKVVDIVREPLIKMTHTGRLVKADSWILFLIQKVTLYKLLSLEC